MTPHEHGAPVDATPRERFLEAAKEDFLRHISISEGAPEYDGSEDALDSGIDHLLDSLECLKAAQDAYVALGGKLDRQGLPLRSDDEKLVGLSEE